MDIPQNTRETMGYKGPNVRLCTDGKYHWTYPMNMLKNPFIYLTVCKIFGIIGGIGFVIGYIGPVLHGKFDVLLKDLKWWGVAVLVFLVLSFLSYLIVAAMYGWRYVVRFTMNEKGLRHEVTPDEAKKAKKLGRAVSGAGVLSGNIGRVGQGMMIANHTSLSSDFSRVKRIKAYPRFCTIKLNEPFAKNQVYTTPEDFDFVLNYIRSHCPKAK
jgi:hypothetical protein